MLTENRHKIDVSGNIDHESELTKRIAWVQKSEVDGAPVWRVLGAVQVPGEVDTQGEARKPEQIEATAKEWFLAGRQFAVDTNHNYIENGAYVWQSFISRPGDLDFPVPGTWAVMVETQDPVIGAQIDSGELNAFSWAGPVIRKLYFTLVHAPVEASGTTEKSDFGPYPEHDHTVEALKFDANAKPVPTVTGETYGHTHDVDGTTRTGFTDGHAHRMLIQRGELPGVDLDVNAGIGAEAA